MKHLTKGQMIKMVVQPKFEKSQMAKDMLFGTFDYMRAELEVLHSGEQFWVNSFDNSKIDCMVIPSANSQDN
jgi:hypothetical protein